MKTGKMKNVGVRKMDGVQMSTSEYDKKFIANGGTIRQTKQGKIYNSPVRK